LLLAGPRAEEREEQQGRVSRAESALVHAQEELRRARASLDAELEGLSAHLAAARIDAEHARVSLRRTTRLRAVGAVSEEAYREAEKRWEMGAALAAGQRGQLLARHRIGPRDAESEVARRQRELADARGALRLLEAGSRPEEIEAEKARLARAREEGRFLARIESQLVIRASQAGQVTTPNLHDRPGQYLREGDLICTVEKPGDLEAEVLLLDQEVVGVRAGQRVQLRPRDQPGLCLTGTVERLAPRAVRGGPDASSTVTGVMAYCRLEDTPEDTRPGALGHARIDRGRRTVRAFLSEKLFGLLRVEFWW
jgi:HlyD family secretion protein